jgi:hypothetical protein
MRFVQRAHGRHQHTRLALRLRPYLRDCGQNFHGSSFTQFRRVANCKIHDLEAHQIPGANSDASTRANSQSFAKPQTLNLILHAVLLECDTSSHRLHIDLAKRRARNLHKQNEHTRDHQSEHPDKIDVEPRAAQYC